MSKRIFNIVRPREYPAADGQVKTAWDRHGVLIVDGKKLSMHLDSIPAGDWNGWLNVFERQDEPSAPADAGRHHGQAGHGQQRPAAPVYPPPQDFEDDIPF